MVRQRNFLIVLSKKIHDGRSSSSHMIGRFCGSTLPKGGNFVTTTNLLYLWFRSDNTTSHDGFELNWDSISKSVLKLLYDAEHPRLESGCRLEYN